MNHAALFLILRPSMNNTCLKGRGVSFHSDVSIKPFQETPRTLPISFGKNSVARAGSAFFCPAWSIVKALTYRG
jgi:hypothetical protein